MNLRLAHGEPRLSLAAQSLNFTIADLQWCTFSRPESNQPSRDNFVSSPEPHVATPPSSLSYPSSLLQPSCSRSRTWAFPSSTRTLNPGRSDPHLQLCAHRSRHLCPGLQFPGSPILVAVTPVSSTVPMDPDGGDLPPIPAWRIPLPSPATLEPDPPAQGSPYSSPGDYGLQLYVPIPAEMIFVSSTHST